MADNCRKPVIGLTGGIGAGKSLVARQLEGMGCGVINADLLAKRALEHPTVKCRLVSWWGAQVLDEHGRVNRLRVAELVFDRPDELARLEGLIHPRVHRGRRALRRSYGGDHSFKAIVEDCPLLLEKRLDADCDVVIFVASEVNVRFRRLASTRNWTAEDLVRREKNQLPLDIKAQRADYVIDNNAGEGDCLSHVRSVFFQVLRTFNT